MAYVIWLFWLIAAVAVVVAVVLKPGEDESPLYRRVAVPGGVFLAVTLLILSVGTTPSGRPIVPSIARSLGTLASPKVRLQYAQAQDQALARQLRDLQEEETRLRTESNSIDDTESLRDAIVAPTPIRQAILTVLLLVFLAIDVVVILYAVGLPLLSLFRKDAKRDEQLALLDELTALVWREDYRGALTKSSAILEPKLRQGELLDLSYLRSYAAVQVFSFPQAGESRETLKGILEVAIKDLQAVIAVEPRRGPALYLLALAFGLAGQYAEASAMLDRAQPELDGLTLPFAHNQSVCLLQNGETHLTQGNIEEAEACFDRVATLGDLSSRVSQVRIRIAMIDLRNAMGRRAVPAAQAVLAKIGGFSGLTADQKSRLEVIGIVLDARAALDQGDPDKAAAATETFLARHMPAGLPALGDDIADEVFSPMLDGDLTFPREVYRDILLMTAIARTVIQMRKRAPWSESDVGRVSEPLLRALQIEPRQRDLLAAIGGLYYWTRREMRARAREWLEAAVTMGVESRFARSILARDRAVEADRREALDHFRSASARFLRDPSLKAEMRRALVEELGRFQEFEPMLISFQERQEFDYQEPSVTALRERAKYLADLMDSARRRGDTARYGRLDAMKTEYARALASLEQSAKSIEALERSVIVELGSALTMV